MGHRKGVWIPVVTGLIQKEGMVLMGQRPRGNSLAGLWEFPGGKVELGESPEQALERELREELGIFAEVGTLRLATTHSYGEKAVLMERGDSAARAVGVALLFADIHHQARMECTAVNRIGENGAEPIGIAASDRQIANENLRLNGTWQMNEMHVAP